MGLSVDPGLARSKPTTSLHHCITVRVSSDCVDRAGMRRTCMAGAMEYKSGCGFSSSHGVALGFLGKHKI